MGSRRHCGLDEVWLALLEEATGLSGNWCPGHGQEPGRSQGSGGLWLHGRVLLATVVAVVALYAGWERADNTCPTRTTLCLGNPGTNLNW